jgi:hypothetical protein
MSAQKQVASTLLAAWLAENHPDVFNELLVRATNPAGGAVRVQLAPPDIGLSGFTDTLSSIWGGISKAATTVASGLGTAVKGVGNFLGTEAGASVLATAVALKYGGKSTQASIIDTQYQRSQAGVTPAPIQTVYDQSTGTYVPVLNQQTSQGAVQYPLSNQILNQLQPSFIDKYGVWLIGGGIGLVLLVTLLGGRRS